MTGAGSNTHPTTASRRRSVPNRQPAEVLQGSASLRVEENAFGFEQRPLKRTAFLLQSDPRAFSIVLGEHSMPRHVVIAMPKGSGGHTVPSWDA